MRLRSPRTPSPRRAWFLLLLGLTLSCSGCAVFTEEDAEQDAPAVHHVAIRDSSPADRATPVSAAFDAGGRLWRVRVDARHVYVDSSTDQGESFSSPVVLNPSSQTIRASAEDRPGIAVRGEKIYVTWAADAHHPWTIYFSYSTDHGRTFSAPTPLSDRAGSCRGYLALPLLDARGVAHFFWHDERDQNGRSPTQGESALYHATQEKPEPISPVARRITQTACENGRMAAALDTDGRAVLFSRIVYPIAERDMGLMRITSDGRGWASWRVSDDNWETKACPEHGPALSIGPDKRYHIAWYTQGKTRKGLYYAWSSDGGRRFSRFMPFGSVRARAGHPAVLSLGSRVALAWQEVSGGATHVRVMLSEDGGGHWSPVQDAGESSGAVDYPFLITDGRRIYLSWAHAGSYTLKALD